MFFFRTILSPGILWSNKTQFPITIAFNIQHSHFPKAYGAMEACQEALWTEVRNEWTSAANTLGLSFFLSLPLSTYSRYGRQSFYFKDWRWWSYWLQGLYFTSLSHQQHCHAPNFFLEFFISRCLSVFSILIKTTTTTTTTPTKLQIEGKETHSISWWPC